MKPVSRAHAAMWTVAAIRSARRQLRGGPVESVVLPPPPQQALGRHRVLLLVLRASRSTCLTSATVRQAWWAAHGRPRDLVVGVTAPKAGFKAHAWLEGDPESRSDEFVELLRRTAPATSRGA